MPGKIKMMCILIGALLLCQCTTAMAKGSLPVKFHGPWTVKAGQTVSFHLQVTIRPGRQNELIFVSNSVNGQPVPVARGTSVSPRTAVLNKNQLAYWYWMGNSRTVRQDWILRLVIPKAATSGSYCLGVTARDDASSWLGGFNPPEYSFCTRYSR